MANRLAEYFMKHYGLYYLPFATEQFQPGMILDVRWSNIFSNRNDYIKHYEGLEGFVWDIVDDMSKDDFQTDFYRGAMDPGEVKGSYKFGLDISLPQLGIDSLDASLEGNNSAIVEVTGVKALTFEKHDNRFALHQAVRSLKKTDPDRYESLDDDLLITEAYHVSSFTATFVKSFTADAKVAIENKATSGGTLTWSSDTTFSLTGVADVPFAVNGVRL